MKRFLIVGLGSIGRRHLVNLASLYPEADFTILRHKQRPDVLADRLGASVVTRLEDVIDESFDLVVLATPSANHIDLLPELIRRGFNLLVEKPIVSSLGDCDSLIDELAAAPAAVRVSAFNFRHVSSLVALREQVHRGILGNVVRASFTAGQWLPDWRPFQNYRQSYSADPDQGGGVELDLVHEIDLARWIFGELNLEFARCGKFSDLEISSHDTAMMVFSPQNGSAPVIQIALDYVSRQRLRHYEIVGDRAGLNWNIDGALDLVEPDGRRSLEHAPNGFDIAKSYIAMLERTLRAVEGDWQEPLQTLEDGIESTRLAIQVREKGGQR